MKKILLAALLAFPIVSMAQSHHEFGITGGISSYYGDLQPNIVPNKKFIEPSVGILYKYFFNPKIGLRFGANYIRLTAADSLSDNVTSQKRNLSFRNNMFEMYAGVEYNFMSFDFNRFKFTPYIFAGVGGFYGNPYALDLEDKKHFLRDLSTEGQGLPGYNGRNSYSLVNASFPIGIGAKFLIGKSVILGAEVNFRYTSTDYLDDVSRSYVNLDSLQFYKGSKAVEMSYRGNEKPQWDGNYPNYQFQRGDFKGNDWYMTVGMTATIYFDAFGNAKTYLQSRCPKIFGAGR